MTLKNRLRQSWQLYLMLIPGIVALIIFHYIPLYGIVIAFQDYNPALGFKSKWVGLDHFRTLFKQNAFLRTIPNTLFISFWKMVGGIVVPVLFAILLNEIRVNRVKRSFQTIVYLPNFLSWVILAGILNGVLADNGIVNNLLQAIGIGPIGFLSNPDVFPYTMIFTDIWKGFGFGTVVYLAALTSIDPQLYESAELDGASRFQKMRYITLPMLLPIITLMTVLSLGSVLNAGFDQVFNMYSPVVYAKGDIIDTFVYRMGFERAQYSVGAAVGLFKSLISSLLVIISYVLAYRVANYRVF